MKFRCITVSFVAFLLTLNLPLIKPVRAAEAGGQSDASTTDVESDGKSAKDKTTKAANGSIKEDNEDADDHSSNGSVPNAASAGQPTGALSSGTWWHPRPGTKWQIQYVGGIDTSTKVDMFDLDLFDTDISIIQALHANGTKVVCYFSAGSFEAWRPDVKRFPSYVLGRQMEGWKGERWLDIRKLKVLRPIMEDRIKLAKQKGCDALDPDNVEGYDNKSGFDLAASDQIAYNKMLAEIGHSMGLAVGLKNDIEQIPELTPYFDFQVNEQCFEYQGCNDLLPFIKANKPVFNIEYNVAIESFCPRANAMNFDSVKKDLDLDAKVKRCR